MIKQPKTFAKLFALAFATLFVSSAAADFDLAMNYYTKGEFKPAFKEFMEAAIFSTVICVPATAAKVWAGY
jgi:hypothetical protein